MTIAQLAAELKLSYVRQHYENMVQDTALTHDKMLYELLKGEYENRVNNGISRRIKEAKFPYKKYLVDFDKSKYGEAFQSAFAELETLEFIGKNENVILIGTTGAGHQNGSVNQTV